MPHFKSLLIDDSLSLINRTGAHFIAKDLVQHFGSRGAVRRWRMFGRRMPDGLPRKLLARLMLKEMHWLGQASAWPWPDVPHAIRLFLDPLYVMRSRLTANDIVLCHDIGPVTHPAIYDAGTVEWYSRVYEKLVRCKPGMVFVSRSSQAAFASRFGLDFRFQHSIPLYVRNASVDGPMEAVDGITKPFFLSVGALEKRKNHRTTMAAFELSRLADAGVSLVICGSRGDEAVQVAQQAARTPGVRLPGYVSDAQLRWLYHEALAFVLPSRLEGFGMPALEAAQYGLIPIVSRDGALNEAIGGLGLAVDAESPDDIAQALQRVHGLGTDEREAWQARLTAFSQQATRDKFIYQWERLLSAELASHAHS
ncbi:glycosyltransferase [Piscinibacter sp.]|jgi:glycosyltransferase involved in cell wall biosynthesis|uniref:glycosyltransferase n=1 Tax=Piscinibacter sp. TaxID=1903157 RepID=UPI002F41A077